MSELWGGLPCKRSKDPKSSKKPCHKWHSCVLRIICCLILVRTHTAADLQLTLFSSGTFNLICSFLCVVSLQSCHLGEDDEGGEQDGEEPSFEVRQTEMVWGDQGKGWQGRQWRSSSPRHQYPHGINTLAQTPQPTPQQTATIVFFSFLFFNLRVVSLTTPPAMADWAVHAFAGYGTSQSLYFSFPSPKWRVQPNLDSHPPLPFTHILIVIHISSVSLDD